MSYVKDESHFVNLINKILRESRVEIDPDLIMTKEFYLNEIYYKNLADPFTWALRSDASLIYEDNVLDFISGKTECEGYFIEDYDYDTSRDQKGVAKYLQRLRGVAGIYIFKTKTKILYIGTSINLASRIRSSSSRLNEFKNSVMLTVIECKTASDAAVLEVYMIGKYKPVLNGKSKYQDELTIELLNIPDESFTIPFLKPLNKK